MFLFLCNKTNAFFSFSIHDILISVGLREWVLPQDKVFFDLLESLAALVVEGAEELLNLMEDYEDLSVKVQKIKEIEHKADLVSHRVYEQLNLTFITPIEPEEISRLASALDDIIDYINSSTRKMLNYEIKNSSPSMVEFSKLIRQSVLELYDAVKVIRSFRDPHGIEAHCIEVNRLENLADDLLARTISDLFKSDDPMIVIKLKDIYECLEVATDKCEDAANVLSNIAIRHS